MSVIKELFSKPVLIFGCGNILIGDDGFGPSVIDHLLAHFDLPANVAAFDVGTGIREFLFDLALLPGKREAIFIVDAVFESGRPPGEVFELGVGGLPENKVNDFCPHMFPSVNLLEYLQNNAGVRIRVLTVQAESMQIEIRQGLSNPVNAAVPVACRWLMERIGELS